MSVKRETITGLWGSMYLLKATVLHCLELDDVFDRSWNTLWQRVNLRPELAAADTLSYNHDAQLLKRQRLREESFDGVVQRLNTLSVDRWRSCLFFQLLEVFIEFTASEQG